MYMAVSTSLLVRASSLELSVKGSIAARSGISYLKLGVSEIEEEACKLLTCL